MNQLPPSARSNARRRAAVVATLLAGAAWAVTVRSADRDALRQIVQQQCLPHWSEQHDPAPCLRIEAPEFAVLADRKGGAHLLLIATRTITGIEDPALLAAAAPNYFAAAWRARDRLAAAAGHALARDAIGLAINSALARGQDQLHIHIECLRPRLQQALRAAAATARLGDRWSALPGKEFPYQAIRLRGADLDGVNPFALLADGQPGARANMAAYTLIVAGAQFHDGPGFIVLAGRTPTREALLLPLAQGLVPPGETMLDSSCALDPDQVQPPPSSPPDDEPPSSQPPPSETPKSGPPRSAFGSGCGCSGTAADPPCSKACRTSSSPAATPAPTASPLASPPTMPDPAPPTTLGKPPAGGTIGPGPMAALGMVPG
jgi:CDP-diacylglycerol pyrophosphatase